MDWQRIPTINAGRVSLRPIVENDIDSLYAIYSDPEVMRYWGDQFDDLVDRELTRGPLGGRYPEQVVRVNEQVTIGSEAIINMLPNPPSQPR